MATLLVLVCFFLPPALSAQPVINDQLIVEKCSFGEFDGASRVLVNVQKQVYVVDRAKNRILLFRDPQSPPTAIGGYGWNPSSFDTPSGIATDGLNIYVADYGNHRIQRFDRSLSFISSFSTRDSENPDVRFGYPMGVEISKQGDLLILDGENVRVLRFSPRSAPLGSFGESDTRLRRLTRPLKIVVSPSDRIYVLEPHRLIEYDHVGNFLRTIGDDLLSEATSVVIGEKTILVIEPRTVFIFDTAGKVLRKITRETMVTEHPIGQFVDAAFVETDFYLLSPRQIHVFELADILRGADGE